MAKELTVEQAKANYDKAKEAASARWAEVQGLRKKFKLKPGAKPEAKADAKEYKAATTAHAEAKAAKEEAEKAWKALKPASNVGRSTYEYPADIVSAEDKKRYRAKMRREKAAGEKAEGAPKKEKKAKKAEAAVEAAPAKASKKDKKAKKAKVAEEDED